MCQIVFPALSKYIILFHPTKQPHKEDLHCIYLAVCAAWLTPALSQASAKASATSRLILKPLVMYPAFFWYFSVAIVCAFGLPLGIVLTALPVLAMQIKRNADRYSNADKY